MGAFLTSLLAGVVTGETKRVARNALRAAIMYAVVGVLCVLGALFLLLAGYVEAAMRFGARNAALGFGGGFLLLALLVYLGYVIGRGSRRRAAQRRRQGDLSSVATAAAVGMLPLLLRGKGAMGLLAVPAALVAYEILRENRRRPPRDPEDDEL